MLEFFAIKTLLSKKQRNSAVASLWRDLSLSGHAVARRAEVVSGVAGELRCYSLHCSQISKLRICEQCRLGRNLQSLFDAEIPRRRANGDLVFSRIRPPVTGSRIEVGKGQPIEPERNLLGFARR